MNRARWFALLSLALPCPVLAQGVLVAPHAVHIDHATRAGSITLFNPGSTPAEVTVSLAFGYPQTDSAGDISLPLSDSAPAGQPAAPGAGHAGAEVCHRTAIRRPQIPPRVSLEHGYIAT